MAAKRQKTAHLSVYIRPELKAAFDGAAEQAGISATTLFERLATVHCRKVGTLAEDDNGNGKPAKVGRKGK